MTTDPALAAAIGEKLKTLRTRRNLSQADIATALGVERNTYTMIENGHNLLTLTHLVKLTTLLDCGLLDIIPAEYVTEYDHVDIQDDSLRELAARWSRLPEAIRESLLVQARLFDQWESEK